MFGKLLEEILMENTPSARDITDAISNRHKVRINYNSGGKDKAKGYRVVDVYDYGLSSKGDKLLRVFQEYGDSTGENDTFTPGWKTLRVDRIEDWEDTGQIFDEVPSDRYGRYNPDGDKVMTTVLAKAEIPDTTTDEKGNYIPAGERRLKSLAANKGKVYNIADLRNKYGFGRKGMEKDNSQLKGSDLKGPQWNDFEKRGDMDAYNERRKEERWKNAADTRALHRTGSVNRELVDFDRENPAFVKGKIDPSRLEGTSSVSLDDDFWNQAEKDLQNMRKKENRYSRENEKRAARAADTRNLHRAGSVNRNIPDTDTDY